MKKNDEPKKNEKNDEKNEPKKKRKKTKMKTYFKILSHFIAYNSSPTRLFSLIPIISLLCFNYRFVSLFLLFLLSFWFRSFLNTS